MEGSEENGENSTEPINDVLEEDEMEVKVGPRGIRIRTKNPTIQAILTFIAGVFVGMGVMSLWP